MGRTNEQTNDVGELASTGTETQELTTCLQGVNLLNNPVNIPYEDLFNAFYPIMM